ncbi:MAG: SRPBCC family protein [Nitriliruptor sp.]
MATCRPETPAFTATAPLRVTATREIAAEPAVIFDTLADTSSWPAWFPGLQDARWISTAPYGVGSTRQVSVGPLRVEEEFIAWEPGVRFGFTFLSMNLPGTRAGVEMVELLPVDDGRTRVSYTMALEPVGVPSWLGPALAPVVRGAIARGLGGLDRHVTGAR